jgi:hypothetical protein
MAGLFPAIPLRDAACTPNQNRRDKPGDDEGEVIGLSEDASVPGRRFQLRADRLEMIEPLDLAVQH